MENEHQIKIYKEPEIIQALHESNFREEVISYMKVSLAVN